MTMTDTDLRSIRAEVGSSPDDDTIGDLFADLEAGGEIRWQATALQILSTRLADIAAQNTHIQIGRALTVAPVPSPGNVDYLRFQIHRLQAVLSGVGSGGRIVPVNQRSPLGRPFGGPFGSRPWRWLS